MSDAQVILALLASCAAVGFLLYLPFMLWFRRRRRRGRSPGPEAHIKPAGLVFAFGMIAAMCVVPVARVVAPESSLVAWTAGDLGLVRWCIGVFVVAHVLENALSRGGRFEFMTVAPAPGPAGADPGEATPAPRMRGAWRLATVKGVPIVVQASLPTSGLLVALFADAGFLDSATYCLAFMALIAVHELGHFVAARLLGLRVFVVVISGAGGYCLTQVPRGVRDTFALFSAGLVAQALLFTFTVAAVVVRGEPATGAGFAVVVTFTIVNLVLGAINLLPGRSGAHLSNDGAMLWDLLLHAVAGRPHPLASQHAASPLLAPDTDLFAGPGLAPPGFHVGVAIFNDDSTPMEFVHAVLQRYLALDPDAATATVLRIHREGAVLFALADRAAAEAVASAIFQLARAQGHALVCRVEEAPPGAVPA